MGSTYAKFGAYHTERFGARALTISTNVILRPIRSYANEGNPGSSTFCLPFYYQALSTEKVYATYCAYDIYIFGARVLNMTTLTKTKKILVGHFVYANDDNTGSLKFLFPFRFEVLSIGSIYYKFCKYYSNTLGARAVGLSTIVIYGSMTIYANERIPEVEIHHYLSRVEA